MSDSNSAVAQQEVVVLGSCDRVQMSLVQWSCDQWTIQAKTNLSSASAAAAGICGFQLLAISPEANFRAGDAVDATHPRTIALSSS